MAVTHNSGYPALIGMTQSNAYATVSSPTNITGISATLSGSVSPSNVSTTVRFLYGTTSGVYTNSVKASLATVSGSNTSSVSATLTGLAQTTTYYYCISGASASAGYFVSNEKSFTTPYANAGNTLKLNPTNSTYLRTSLVTTATSNYTIEGWVKWNGATPGSSQQLFYNGNSASSGYGVILPYNHSYKVSFIAGGKGYDYSNFILPPGQWTHVALTCDASNNFKVYVNGDSVVGGTIAVNTPAGNFHVGGYGGEYFNGSMEAMDGLLRQLPLVRHRLPTR